MLYGMWRHGRQIIFNKLLFLVWLLLFLVHTSAGNNGSSAMFFRTSLFDIFDARGWLFCWWPFNPYRR